MSYLVVVGVVVGRGSVVSLLVLRRVMLFSLMMGKSVSLRFLDLLLSGACCCFMNLTGLWSVSSYVCCGCVVALR